MSEVPRTPDPRIPLEPAPIAPPASPPPPLAPPPPPLTPPPPRTPPASATLLNPANMLTLSRVPLAFAYMFLFSSGHLLAALIALSILELTDLFDGIVARKLNCVSDFGKLVDPFCDSFSRLTVFFTLAAAPLMIPSDDVVRLVDRLAVVPNGTYRPWPPLLPLWMPVVCLLRDLAVAFVRTVAAGKGVIVAARPSGKWKALVQGPVVIAITALAWLSPGWAVTLSPWLMLAATVVTAYSLVDYVAGNRHVF